MSGVGECRRTRVARRIIVAITVFVGIGLAAPAHAQTAQLAGLVRDSSSAVIVGATLVLENEATGTSRTVRSNDTGLYAFPLLAPGTYRLTIEAPSFKRLSRRGLELTVGQNARLDITLDLAAVETSMSVEGSVPRVNSHDASVGVTLDRRVVQSLPLSGRTFQSLINLAPGVALTAWTGASGGFSVNGQRSMSNYFTIDGASANVGVDLNAVGVGQAGSGAAPGLASTGGTNTLVSMDAFREVTILTSTFAPEYGRTPGAQVSIVTRSGSSQFTGSAFEYYRNNKLDANDWFVNNKGGTAPGTHYHDFGATLGGPLRRSNLFFFGSYEGQRIEQPIFVISQTPSLASRASASDDLRAYLNAFPLPNGPALTAGLAEFDGSFARPSDLDSGSVRVDFAPSPRHTLFVRLARGDSHNLSRGLRTAAASLATVEDGHTRTVAVTTGLTSTLSSSLVNDLRVNYTNNDANVNYFTDTFGGAVPVATNALMSDAVASGATQLQFNLFRGNGGYNLIGPYAAATQRQFNLTDTLSFIRDKHQFKFGVDYRRLDPETSTPDQRYTYVFSNVADLLAHRVNSGTVERDAPAQVRFDNLSLFAQDTYNVTNRLTLTYGVRYEVNPAPSSTSDVSPLLVTGVQTPENLQTLPYGTELWSTTYTNLAPRVGAAYRLVTADGAETVLRAGWGIFYDLGTGRSGDAFGRGYPYRIRRSLSQATFPLAQNLLVPPDLTQAPGTTDVYAFPSDLKLPRTYQWNVTVERELGHTQSVSVGYVGAAGRKQLDAYSYNIGSVSPTIQLVDYMANTGSSDYNALQVQVRRRISHGLQGLLSYTWGHSIDTDSGEVAALLAPAERILPNSNRGNSDFDIRHSLNFAVSYQVPAPAGLPRLKPLLSQWQLDVIGTFRSGPPITPATSFSTPFGLYSLRPNVVPGVPFYVDDPAAPGGVRLNKDAFQATTVPANGNLGRNTLRTFGLKQIDLALSRSIPFSATLRTELRIEAFNVFNTPNFGRPVTALAAATFGVAAQTLASSLGTGALLGGGLSPLNQVGGPRSVQLAVRLGF